jgi:hypothetical protein
MSNSEQTTVCLLSKYADVEIWKGPGADKDMASLTRSVAYNEEAFQCLLEGESKRSKRSGHLYYILLIYCTNEQGILIAMESNIAKTVIAALSRSLRDTDYIGWYRAGLIVGGVLTVVKQESMAQVSSHIQKRMADALQVEPRIAENPRLQIRVCQYHELEGVEIGALSGRTDKKESDLSPGVRFGRS